MNNNRIFRVLNVIFLSCGYHVHWFNTSARKFQLSLVGCFYFLCLMIWYGICFQQHFSDSSIFNFLNDIAPALYKSIHIHLFLGIKVMIFSVYEMRYIVRALNDFVKGLTTNVTSKWSWQESVAYNFIFSGILINSGFILYVMIQMEFLMPTLRQIMQATAMFLPHFAIACSVKLTNLTLWITSIELQSIAVLLEDNFRKETFQRIVISQVEDKTSKSIELTPAAKQLKDTQICFKTLESAADHLENISCAVNKVNHALQTQLVLFFTMNSIGLFGATYSIMYYKLSWNLILEGVFGNSLMAFNIGVFVFVFWDYLCLCLANVTLDKKKTLLLVRIDYYLKSKPTPPKDIRRLLKKMKNDVLGQLNMRILFTAPITKQTFILVNMLVGLTISMFMVFFYFKEQIEMLQMQFADE